MSSIRRISFGDNAKDLKLSKPTRTEIARIGKYILPTWRLGLFVLSLTIAIVGASLVPPLFIKEMVDSALPQKNRLLLSLLAIGMIMAPLCGGLLGVWRKYLVLVLAQNVVLELRARIYERLVHQSFRYFVTVKPGEMLSRIQSDTAGVQTAIGDALILVITNILLVTGTLVMLFRLNWVLALVALSVLPLFVIPTQRVGDLAGKLVDQTQVRMGELISTIQETLTLSGYLVIRLFGAQRMVQERFLQSATQIRDLQIQQGMAGRWFLMTVALLSSIGPALIFLVGGLQIMSGTITLGTVLAFVGYLGLLYGPVGALVSVHVDLMRLVAYFRRIFEYMDLTSDTPEPERPVRLENPRGELSFVNVGMEFGTTRALKGVSFNVRPGEMVALVGPSGAGKTTASYLALRLYDPTEGRVMFDGLDLSELAKSDIARHVAVVTQETHFFNTSIAENLRYAKADASEAELEAACRLAQIHDVIAALPEGYKTLVGERGYKLSGGEKQRLAIARVLLRDPRILILDEATSSLDSHSEALIQRALEPLFEGRTSLVIAHRLSTVVRANLILVLDRGQVVERGTHEELLQQHGLYSRLYKEQFAAALHAS